MFIQKRKIVLKMGSKNWLHVCVIALLALFVLTFFIAAASAEGGYSFITKWGSEGTGDGQFQYPFGVAVDSSGDVFVTDSGNHRIQKFDSSGGYITKWGSEGTGDGQFCHHYGVAVDSSGDVFVADTYNHRIQKFDSSGGFITKWGSSGTGDGQFDHPHGVAVDSSGDVFVADTYNHRIQKFDSSGTYITKWGSYGTGDGQFFAPYGVAVASSGDVFVADTYNHGVAVASSGDVFVADTYNHRIQKFDSSGTYITKWGSYGTGDGQFDYPHGVAVDSSGDVFVADTSNHRIQMSDSSGGFITKWGSPGTGDGQFDDPSGVAVDSSGDVFVADSGNNRIQKFGEGSAPPPPHVTGIMPGCGHPGQTVDVSITGTDFRAVPMTVELQRDAVTIGGTDVLLISDTLLTCKFDLTGAPRGLWDVYLKHNDDDQSSTLPGAFDVQFRPPYVTGVNPDFGHPDQTLDVSITGTDFRRVPTTVELQRGVETPIVGTDVSYDSDTLVTCKLDLTDAPLGAWDVYVKHNDDGQSSTLPGAFDVQFRPPDVTSIMPGCGHPGQTVDVSITGTDFRRVPTTVELQRGVETPIVGTDVSYDSDTLVTCKLDLTDAPLGAWDVYVKHNDDGQSSTLPGAFDVQFPPPPMSPASCPAAGTQVRPLTYL